MPESKTIEIDEVLPAGQDQGKSAHPHGSDNRPNKTGQNQTDTPPNPFADLEKALPWKARWTLRLTRWFMLIRSKPWGAWVIVPGLILAIILAIPIGIITALFLIVRSFFKSLSR